MTAIEEQWAIFLRKIDDGIIKIQNAYKEYKKFSKQIRQDYQNNNAIKNPYYYIIIANDFVYNDSALNDKYSKAMDYYDRAIKLD